MYIMKSEGQPQQRLPLLNRKSVKFTLRRELDAFSHISAFKNANVYILKQLKACEKTSIIYIGGFFTSKHFNTGKDYGEKIRTERTRI